MIDEKVKTKQYKTRGKVFAISIAPAYDRPVH